MNKLKQIRLKNNWTQQFVADEIGITKASYSNIETRKRSPSLKVALQLQKVFGQPIECLLENINNDGSAPTKE